MSEQEMQFADPDWKPGGQRNTRRDDANMHVPQPVNDTTFETSQYASSPSYEQGYQGPLRQEQPYYAPYASRQMPANPAASTRRRSRWWLWAIILIIVLSMIGGTSRSFHEQSSFPEPFRDQHYPAQQASTFDLTGVSQVQINDLSGSIQLQADTSNSNQLAVQSDSEKANSLQRVGSTLMITLNPSPDASASVVTLPPGMTVFLGTSAGTIEVDGYSGQVSAKTDSGSITLNGDTLTGSSVISSNSGDIDLAQGSASGKTSLSTTYGSIALGQEALSGQFAAVAGANGSISLNGMLDPKGTYQFTTSKGNIDLTLPADTSMQVQIPTGAGGSYHSDFPTSTGNAPRADVHLNTTAGQLNIHKQSS